MILITGATGFIGYHLAKELYRKGYNIRCLVRDPAKAAHIKKQDVAVGDMRDKDSLINATEGCSTVIHLAAPIGHDDYKTNYDVTVQGMANLIEACRINKIKRIVFFSSIAVFIQTNYGRTKLMAEEILRRSGMDVTILRGDWIYGERDWSLSRLSRLIAKSPFIPIPGDGNYRKRPIYVGDVVKAIITCLEKKSTINKTYMLGGPQVTYNEMLDMLLQPLGIRKKKVHLPKSIFFAAASLFELLGIRRLITKNNILGMTFDSSYDTEMTERDLVKPVRFEKGLAKCSGYYKSLLDRTE